MITTEQIKTLRDETGISIGQCKQALTAAGGDLAGAKAALRAAGTAIAEKKATRALAAGVVESYVHTNHNLGSLVVLSCETDFVAKNPEFRALASDIAMQVAAIGAADVTELLVQPFIKDTSLLVADVLKNAIQKFGERIELAHFSRLVVGE